MPKILVLHERNQKSLLLKILVHGILSSKFFDECDTLMIYNHFVLENGVNEQPLNNFISRSRAREFMGEIPP